jgi:hypothetical protein
VEKLEVHNHYVLPTEYVEELNARSEAWRVDPKRSGRDARVSGSDRRDAQ